MEKKRILVVDDEQAFTRFVKTALEQAGSYEVREESESERALATAKAFKPDFIFMDIEMPRLEGSEVVARFQEDEDLKKIPVVFLTGAVTQEEADKAGGIIGGRAFLAKPVQPQQLLAVVERYLGP